MYGDRRRQHMEKIGGWVIVGEGMEMKARGWMDYGSK